MSTVPQTRLDDELVTHWRIIATAMLGLVVSAAVVPSYAVGAFVLPLQAEFGWSRSQIQAAVMFSQGGCALSGLVVAVLAQRLGMRRLAIFGLLGVSASFAFGAIAIDSLPLYYATFAAVALLGCGSVPVVWCRIVTGRFERRRGLALGLALTGTGVAGVLIPPLLVATNSAYDWRAGFLILAVAPLLVALPAALAWLPREKPAFVKSDVPLTIRMRQGLTEAGHNRYFWIILASVISLYIGITGILTNVIPAMTSNGMEPASAAIIQSGYAFSLIFGRLFIGWLVDRFWAPGVAAASLTPAAVGALLLSGQPSFEMAMLGISLVGLAAGAELDLLAFLVARYFGLRAFANVYSLLYFGVAAAGAAGPIIFALTQEAFADYRPSFYIASALLVIGGLLLLALGPYPKAIKETDTAPSA